MALHASGTLDGTDWLMTLLSTQQQDHMQLEEQHIRGQDMSTYRQYYDGMWRAKP